MPDPFTPLTLKPQIVEAMMVVYSDPDAEGWDRGLLANMFKSACEEMFEQAQAAASLREELAQARQDANDNALQLVSENAKLRAQASQAEAALAALQETYNRVEAACVQFEAQSMEQTALAIEAEAALKEMQKLMEKWLTQNHTDIGETPLDDYGHEVVREVLAELQRRRSRPAQ